MSTTVPNPLPVQMRQNWILGPTMDFFFVIGTAIFGVMWGLGILATFGSAAAITFFMVFNTAHHMPTFIRIYGDRDLLKRFRWSILLGPILPFSLIMGTVSWFILNGRDVNFAMSCLVPVLLLWDPWHFIMQHYGFMRIYDRNNLAPRQIAARMDLMISLTWFAFIMIAAAEWLPGILYDLTNQHGFPLLLFFDHSVVESLQSLTLTMALFATVVYLGYLGWCWFKGYFISYAKLAMTVITMVMTYLAYVPNPVLHSIVAGMKVFSPEMPDWDFSVGFAAIGMMHVTQYLAIVWKYNRGLASKRGQARSGIFTSAFKNGGALIALGYILFCVFYGLLLSEVPSQLASKEFQSLASQWVLGFIVALLFTSTVMHYYYDGFIWKVRHKENQRHLKLAPSSDASVDKAGSWWDNASRATAPRIFTWHCFYFAAPMLFLIAMFWMTNSKPTSGPLTRLDYLHAVWQDIARMQDQRDPRESQLLRDQIREATTEALLAAVRQLTIEQRMIEIEPRAEHFAYSFELVSSLARVGSETFPEQYGNLASRIELLKLAQQHLEGALSSPGGYEHRESDTELPRSHWEKQLTIVRAQLRALSSAE